MKRGSLITFEGGEGTGKTTQEKLLADALRDTGFTVECVRSPGGTVIAEKLRSILKTKEPGEDLTPECELLLFGACHAQLTRRYLEPSLAAGKIILCDRFFDSTMVYQGYARGLDCGMVRTINAFSCGELKPDLTIVLDIDPAEGLARAEKRAETSSDRFDAEKMEFHEKVRQGFLELARLEPERFRVVPASGSIEDVSQKIRKCVKNVLGLEFL